MSDVSFELTATNRNQYGKANARRIRHLDQVPAIIYGAGKDPHTIALNHNEILHALENEAFYSHILTLNIDGSSEQVVLKDLQRHSTKPRIQHVDFLRIKAKEKLTMMVPIHFPGEEDAPGVKAGGVVSKLINEIEVRCLPANLPEFLELDISQLEMNQSLHISQIKLPPNVELTIAELDEEHDQAVVNVHEPKVTKADLEAEAEEAAAAEAAAAESAEATGGEEAKAAEGGEGDKKPEAEAEPKAAEGDKQEKE
ncbi:MAG: 50S ribosomal protein L25/general stress protein Ctc [Gammaproteobacteria bacterium]|nr:50S ribosomal protein L25/general stress protein Ctc [Gammaproteobacteria bacterium]